MKIASFKYIFTMFLCCFLLVSCGGGGSNSETKITPFTLTLDIKKGTSDSPAYVSVQKNEEGWIRLTGERKISINKSSDTIKAISFCNEKRPVETTENGETKTVDKNIKVMSSQEYSAIQLSLLNGKRTFECGGLSSSSSQDKKVKLLISSKNSDVTVDKVEVIRGSFSSRNENGKLSIQLPNTNPISFAVIGKQTNSNSNIVAYYLYGKNNYKFSDGDELSIDFKNEGEVLEKFTPNVLYGQKYTLAYDLNNSPAGGGYLNLSDDNAQGYWRFSSASSKFSYSESWVKKIGKDSGVNFKKSSNTCSRARYFHSKSEINTPRLFF